MSPLGLRLSHNPTPETKGRRVRGMCSAARVPNLQRRRSRRDRATPLQPVCGYLAASSSSMHVWRCKRRIHRDASNRASRQEGTPQHRLCALLCSASMDYAMHACGSGVSIFHSFGKSSETPLLIPQASSRLRHLCRILVVVQGKDAAP